MSRRCSAYPGSRAYGSSTVSHRTEIAQGWGLDVLRSEGFTDADLTAEVDIEKRWQWLHDMLARVTPPSGRVLGYAVMGGTEIGEDLGYGPVRYLAAADVAVAAADLGSLSLDDLRSALPPDENDGLALQWAWDTLQVVRDAMSTLRVRATASYCASDGTAPLEIDHPSADRAVIGPRGRDR